MTDGTHILETRHGARAVQLDVAAIGGAWHWRWTWSTAGASRTW